MRAFILLLGFMCVALSLSCGKTGELYLPDESPAESPGENGSIGILPADSASSKTGSTTGR